MELSPIQYFTISIIPVLLAITVHEAAHGYAAKHFGDKTAYFLGRITLNPIKHIDPIGTVVISWNAAFIERSFSFWMG